jgi:predicted NBD/HSP70 family sugar kinase
MSKNELKSLLEAANLGTPAGRIVRALSERGGLSAAQIARLTGLAKSTVSMTLADMRKSGVVVEANGADAGRTSGAGRPATLLTLNPSAGTCVGALIGLEQIQLVVADVSHAIIASKTTRMDYDYSPAEAAVVIKRMIDETYKEHSMSLKGLLGVGIAIAGPVNPNDGRVQRASVVPTWAGIDIREVLAPVLKRPIVVDNESNCAALAEMMWGAAMGHEDFVLFKIDGGVGGAIVHRGQVMRGIAGGAGEFGHMTINPEGELCRCGNRGCLELYASFKANLEFASKAFNKHMTMDEVILLASQGDVGCRRLIEDTGIAAGRGLGMICTIINPPLVVVGGRMALAGDMILEPLIASYERHTLVKSADVPEAFRTKVVIGKFTTNDSCLGAVGLVLRQHNRPGAELALERWR